MTFNKKAIVSIVVAIFADFSISAQTTDKWINIELETPGTLGVEILYQADKLSDVTHLRVSGPLNDADWGNIKNLTSIQELDLKDAVTTSIPTSAFKSRKSLSSVVLPSVLTTIGNEAFYQTSIENIDLPLSLTTLGQYCFYKTPLKSLVFKENNNIISMGINSFAECDSLKNVVFPKDMLITSLPNHLFYSCDKLSSVTFPQNLKVINNYVFANTPALKSIELPESLESLGENAFEKSGLTQVVIPYNVKTIKQYCFYSCTSLTEVVLPSGVHTLTSYVFGSDKALKKITCASPNPPKYGTNPFNGVTLSNITLIVPDFAIADYKLDDNWLKFGSIQGGANSELWDINGIVNLTNGRRFNGTPSVDIQPGGGLLIAGSEVQPLNQFKLLNNFTSSNRNLSQGMYMNSASNVTAGSVSVTYSLQADYWCFISLPFDVKVGDIKHSDSSASFVVRYYDGATRAANNKTGSSWQNLDTNATITRGKGIIFRTNKDGVITFPCADKGTNTIFNPNSDTLELEANKAASSANSGWNFIANPFPVYFDLYYAMLECPVTVYDHYNRKYVAYSLIDDDVVLYPNQPFFIQASDDINNLVFSTQGRQFSSTINRLSTQSYIPHRSLFDLNLNFNGMTDKTRVVFNNEAELAYELNRDASKFMSDDSEIPQIFTISPEGDYLAINERPLEDGVVRIGFYAPAKGKMSLSLNRGDTEIILRDNLLGKEFKLGKNDEYFFEVDQAGFDYIRFSLIMHTSGINEIESENLSTRIFVNNNMLNVMGMEGKNISVITLDGRIVFETSVASQSENYSLPSGFYVVKCGQNAVKCIIK